MNLIEIIPSWVRLYYNNLNSMYMYIPECQYGGNWPFQRLSTFSKKFLQPPLHMKSAQVS